MERIESYCLRCKERKVSILIGNTWQCVHCGGNTGGRPKWAIVSTKGILQISNG